MLTILKYESRRRQWSIYLGALLICFLELLEHPVTGTYRCDPVSIGITIAVSAALFTAQYALTRLLSPKQKPIQRGKLDGGLQLQDSDFDLFINEIYGGDPGDGKGGGFKLAGIIIDASDIRTVVSTSQESTGGHKGGGGGGHQTVETTSYFMDLDVMVGRGPLVYKKIWFVTASGLKLVYDVTPAYTETGVIDPDFPAEGEQDNFLLPDPLDHDLNPKLRYGHIPTPDARGTIDAQIVGSGYGGIRIYEGNAVQLPDPLFEGINNAKYGAPAGSVAYRGRSHVVFENVDVSNGVPNILFLVENKDLKTLDLILADRAVRTGVLPDDLNFADINLNVRGWAVTQEQAPRSDMEELGVVFDLNFFEDVDGTITGEEQDYTVVATIDEDDLGARTGGGDGSGAPPDLVTIRQAEQTELPTLYNFGFFDPAKNHDANSAPGRRQVTNSEKRETVRHSVVMTYEEGQKAADRDIAKAWSEPDEFTFDAFPKLAYLRPGHRVQVPKDGELYLVKLMEASGSLPGPRHFAGVSQKAVMVSPSVSASGSAAANPANVPANTVATFIDNPRLLSQQNAPGFLVAATPKDKSSGEWKSATVWVDKGDGFKRLAQIEAPATMGRAIGALPDVPGGWSEGDWDDTSMGTLELFYGELASGTDDNPIPMYWGDEVIEYVNGVKDNSGDYPNRWTISRLHRRLKGTAPASATHLDMERVVRLDDAVEFVKVDQSEKNQPRTYKVSTNGLFVSQSVTDAAPIQFTWTGQTLPSFTVAGPNLHVPTIGAAPTVTKDDAGPNWIINAPKPSAHGLPITGHEIRLYSDSACTTLVRTIVGSLEGRTYVPQTSANGYFKYRWRNDSLEDAGGGAGWSALSAASTVAYGTAAGTSNALDSGLTGYDPDPFDSGDPHKRDYTTVY